MPAQVAIVGSGPAGFYTAEALLRSDLDCRVDLYERLPAPFGLVRYGVAPDHQKLKSVTAIFERIADDPRIGLACGVEVGSDLTLVQLREHYDAVVLANGCPTGRALGIPGEQLEGVQSSARFVGWYNGHPDHAGSPPTLDHPAAVVVGMGNVAIDVCRLLCKDASELAAFDVPPSAIAALHASRVREIHLVGRSAPEDAKCTVKELRELAALPHVRVRFRQPGIVARLAGESERAVAWREIAARSPSSAATHTLNVWFHTRPVSFEGEHRMTSVKVRTRDGADEHDADVPSGLAVTCIGYRGDPPAGVPFDAAAGVVGNCDGRVLSAAGSVVEGLYVVGWLRRGPTGVIGTNRADAVAVAQSLVADLGASANTGRVGGLEAVRALLDARNIPILDARDWRALDAWERSEGQAGGAIRRKVLSLDEARNVLAKTRAAHQ